MIWHTEIRKISELKNWEDNHRTITEYNRLKIIDTEKELRLEVNNTVY